MAKKPYDERGNPHGGHGRRVAKDIEEQFVTHAGHPLGEQSAQLPEREVQADMPRATDMSHDQHARKGQAESPRELNLNQPEKKRKGKY